ncbi:ATP-grasp domain-containing protein [Planococcus halotolerans]|uniref:ATP-grasp domain-containing protein n=1 Tax=Planococcus halotolerans TaxID=2233542 RepID=A0A365KJZ0_9BACL|nr:ATP-grasp domain-containing protein [Planococcus halotolerans]RAZ73462.1 hypothetical protein DP120_17165 [Planococcus halotolerans]
MNILVLNSSNYYFTPLNVWLKDFTGNVICLTPKGHLNSYQENIKEKNYKFISIENWHDYWEVENLACALHKKYKFDKILSFREFDLKRAGDLRDLLNIAGQSKHSAQCFRDKDVMKETVRKQGIKTPDFQLLESYSDLYSFIENIGFPIIIKPNDGAGSVNTNKVSNLQELETLIKQNNILNYIAEEFIDGEMYHVDGMVLNKEIQLAIPSKYINGCMEFKKGVSTASMWLQKSDILYQKLIEYTEEVIKSMPKPDNFTFHLEVFVKNNELIFCEIASRTGGGRIPEAIEKKYGIHITKEVARVEAGLSSLNNYDQLISASKNNELLGWVLSCPKVGILKSMPEKIPYEWVVDYHQFAKIGSQFTGSNSSVFSTAAFICVADNPKVLVERIELVDEWFKEICEYE